MLYIPPWFEWEKTVRFWKQDIDQYTKMALRRYDEVFPPFKFRPFIPFLYSLFIPYLSVNASALIWNLLFLFGSNLLIDNVLSYFNFTNIYKITGVIFMNISFPIFELGYAPNVDIPMVFFSFLFLIGNIRKNYWLIGISTFLGVITKESFLLLFPILLIYNFEEIKESIIKKKDLRSDESKFIIFSLIFMCIGLFEFLLIRNFEFNINYDCNLFQLEFPNPAYYQRWLSLPDSLALMRKIAFTFTILWISPLGYLIHNWKIDKWFALYFYGILSIIIMTCLAAHIGRIIYFLIVIYLPLFLKFLKDFNIKNEN